MLDSDDAEIDLSMEGENEARELVRQWDAKQQDIMESLEDDEDEEDEEDPFNVDVLDLSDDDVAVDVDDVPLGEDDVDDIYMDDEFQALLENESESLTPFENIIEDGEDLPLDGEDD